MAARWARAPVGKADSALPWHQEPEQVGSEVQWETPTIKVDPQTYKVRVDGEVITSEPSNVLPMTQRYFLF
jgi:hypothetical protein